MCYKDGINCLESGVGIRCTGHKVVNDDSEMDEIGPEGDFANKIEKFGIKDKSDPRIHLTDVAEKGGQDDNWEWKYEK